VRNLIDKIKSFFTKKHYASSALVNAIAAKKIVTASPDSKEADMYIEWLTRLKAALIHGDANMEKFMSKCLASKGFEVPHTLSQCDKLIAEIRSWQ
jgi:hypothetical protein